MLGSPEIVKFPVNFPDSRELQVETGSYLTAHTTIQSHQTPDFQTELKQAVSVGIFAGIVPAFRSLQALAVSWADFWPPVSASKNSVPVPPIWPKKRRLCVRKSPMTYAK